MKNINTPQLAAVGTTYKVRFDERGIRYRPPSDVETYTVQPKCDAGMIGSGIWHCTTHEQRFENQLQKDLHVLSHRDQKHVCYLAWFCFVHGVAEVP